MEDSNIFGAKSKEKNDGIEVISIVDVFPRSKKMLQLLARKKTEDAEKKEKEKAIMEEEQRLRAERLHREDELRKLRSEKKKKKENDEYMRKMEEALFENDDTLRSLLSHILHDENTDLSLPVGRLSSMQLRIIIKEGLFYNQHILNLDLGRSGLTEEDTKCIAQMIKVNVTLLSLNLQGNCLGPQAARNFGRSLEYNNCLKYLNIESCNITNGGEEQTGIIELAASLLSNKTLRVLNLRNNSLDEEAADALIACLRRNKTIIQLNLERNEITLHQISKIEFLLDENHDIFFFAKRNEYCEKMSMRKEDNLAHNFAMQLESERIVIEGIEKRRLLRAKKYSDSWKNECHDDVLEKISVMEMLQQAYDDRKITESKKKRKKKKAAMKR